MKKIVAGLFLFLFSFQIFAFADTVPPASESKLRKTGQGAMDLMQKAGRSVLDYTYILLRKLDVAG